MAKKKKTKTKNAPRLDDDDEEEAREKYAGGEDDMMLKQPDHVRDNDDFGDGDASGLLYESEDDDDIALIKNSKKEKRKREELARAARLHQAGQGLPRVHPRCRPPECISKGAWSSSRCGAWVREPGVAGTRAPPRAIASLSRGQLGPTLIIYHARGSGAGWGG